MMWIAYVLLLMSWFFGVLWVSARYEPARSGLESTIEYQKTLMGILALIFFSASTVGACTDAIAYFGGIAACAQP